MNIRKSNVITAVLCAAALSATSFYSGYAAADTRGGTGYNSQGKIVFDNGTEDTADDVIFDASDFGLIDNMVTDGKTKIKNELNRYSSIQINDNIPEFNTLAASVSSISNGTNATAGNILSGKKALVGKNIITGTMANHSGATTSTSQIKENGTTAEITIPGGYYDENSKITVPIDVIKNLPTINSNLNKIPGGNTGAPIFQSSNNAGWNDWGSSKSLSYTFTKDYSSVMVYVSGGCSGYGMSSSEDQVKTSMYCNLYPGNGTISCNSGTVIKKNNYYIIQNVRSGSTVTMNFSTSGTQEVAIQAVIWEL